MRLTVTKTHHDFNSVESKKQILSEKEKITVKRTFDTSTKDCNANVLISDYKSVNRNISVISIFHNVRNRFNTHSHPLKNKTAPTTRIECVRNV